MKVTGEAFSQLKRKGAEEVRYQKYQNFRQKTVAGQHSGKL